MNKNRQACFWGPDGNFTTLSDQQSPFCVGKKFSPDGKKLLYFGGWQTEEEAGGAGKVRGAWALYDMETGKKSAILPAGDNDDLDFFDISGNFNPDNANLETFGLSFDGESYETAIVFDAVTLSAYKGQKLTSVGFTRWRLRAAGLSTSTHAAQTVSCRSSTHSRYAEAELRRAQRR